MDIRELAKYLSKLDRIKQPRLATARNVKKWLLFLLGEEETAAETDYASSKSRYAKWYGIPRLQVHSPTDFSTRVADTLDGHDDYNLEIGDFYLFGCIDRLREVVLLATVSGDFFEHLLNYAPTSQEMTSAMSDDGHDHLVTDVDGFVLIEEINANVDPNLFWEFSYGFSFWNAEVRWMS